MVCWDSNSQSMQSLNSSPWGKFFLEDRDGRDLGDFAMLGQAPS